MYKNQYDTDVTVWSPQGRLHQVEYAMKAVQLGSVCLGLRSEGHVVIAAVKKQTAELASYSRKLQKIEERVAIGVSGLTSDARSLAKFMRTECLNHRYVYGSCIQVIFSEGVGVSRREEIRAAWRWSTMRRGKPRKASIPPNRKRTLIPEARNKPQPRQCSSLNPNKPPPSSMPINILSQIPPPCPGGSPCERRGGQAPALHAVVRAAAVRRGPARRVVRLDGPASVPDGPER
uniref:Proteasome subunit alpha type n=1 Tax=Phaeomonas parva TaxID=124430 RepID=A0A7S1UIB0_9STRA|mmetsp:Transcript_6872/g.20025  ORF Transcript_6872/g.20025 Transcript_6872/m.20025 type:complete len:233 (+) Transcript_6872:94-792(+)